jgi:hypothetical protein
MPRPRQLLPGAVVTLLITIGALASGASPTRNTIMFAGFEIDYEVEGDAIIFSLTVPSYTSNGCRQRTAHADNVFYPGEAWERMT